MKPIYLCGRGLACAPGLDINDALQLLRQGGTAATSLSLPGEMGGSFPYHAIAYSAPDWYERARHLIQRVAADAGAAQARNGALFIATSSFNIGAIEQGAAKTDYRELSGKVAAWLDWSGPIHIINTACTSSLNALISAHAMLSAGELEDALVLGVELDNLMTLGGFAALQLLSPTSSKPFGQHRDGLVLGEAVAALRLSTRTTSPWKLRGGANVVDGSQPTGASITAVVGMYRHALAASGLTADAIDLIKVQAAGSPGNDAVEAEGLLASFKEVPPLVSLKAMIGHTMGASGAAEIALLTACLEQGAWPQYEDRTDPSLGIELAANAPDNVRHLMATILGFGGSHATVVLERA
jgi:3-oxoacyl-[acyl-carrier-protein] synthase-1